MAVPVTISGVEITATDLFNMKSCRIGPYRSSAGNFYGFFRQTTDTSLISVQKASDPTSSWSEVATLDITNKLQSIATVQAGDNIHIVTVKDNNTIQYHVFSMASDSFTTSNENTGATPGLNANRKLGIAVRSDGDVVIFYNGVEDTI